jgi:hypothetical protein
MDNQLTVKQLIKEYEDTLKTILSHREKTIFTYAYIVGKQGLDLKDEEDV